MHHQWSTVSGPCQSPGTASGLGAVSTSTWNSSGRGAPRRLAAVGAHRAYTSQPPAGRRIGHTTCNPDERPARPRGSVEQVGDEYGRHDRSRKGPVGCATARRDTAFRKRRLRCRHMPPGVGRGRSEYGFRCHPDAAGRGVAPWVGEFGAHMAPVSAKAGGNWSGEGTRQRAGEGRGTRSRLLAATNRLRRGSSPDFRWPGYSPAAVNGTSRNSTLAWGEVLFFQRSRAS
jgi:hypothetical protein